MAGERAVYMGPRLRRLRRDLGLTQNDMADDLGISPSYVALLERNQRPLTADLLLRLAKTYRLDVTEFAGDGGVEHVARLQAVLRDPMFADLDLPQLANADVATNYPGVTEAFLRLYTAYREEQLALADRSAEASDGAHAPDPVAEARRFLSERRNSFPKLDDAGERLAAVVTELGGPVPYLERRHGLRVRRFPGEIMGDSIRRLDRHQRSVFLDEALDPAGQAFQLATQLAYLELSEDMDAIISEGRFDNEGGARLTRRALASYSAAAIVMPYSAFARAVEERRYDIDALALRFGTSFEQTAHRLTTLQKPGHERVPFFFIRIDPAGNVSKRLDGAGFPFARHGGACPLWSVHHVFRRPGEIVTQTLELPDGQRYFSIARTVTSRVHAFGAPRVERAVALGCAASDAGRLIYARATAGAVAEAPTPIGVTCRLCHRMNCPARSAPPIGRQLLPDDYRRASTPFGFSDN
ncbi:MAG: Transcriptional regulator, Xre family [uncultured Sphingomonadaceae bacterium]|uniref:Transcriptional regulator, Xre family n=1 Tax=uncultured Sphingomonadaceae bacterium TaxID=169976 RepID=A0A6J4TXK7_9SPHN|nr:MAG: Transcriptional regulator, Xre family [uncultured Sphingomonadaceae bacterium]